MVVGGFRSFHVLVTTLKIRKKREFHVHNLRTSKSQQ